MKAFVENMVFKRQTKVLCVGIFLVNRNDWKISVILARIHKNEINIISVAENLNELKDAEEILQQDIPIILHIDGWGVLVKDNSTENGSIPIDNNEFFLKAYPKQDGSGSYFSVIRNDLLKNIIDYCKSGSLNITGISLGPFSMALLSPFFEEGKEIKAGKWKITLSKGYINTLTAEDIDNESTYYIGGDNVTSGILPLYAAIVAFFSGESESNFLITKSRETFIYGRLVKYLSISSLSILLLLLLINYFVWDSLNNRNTELTFEVTRNEKFISQLAEKGKELKEKENLVAQYIGPNSKTRYSWYADRLGLLLPSGIRLTLIDIQPISKKQKNGIAIIYTNRQIDVEGDAANMSDISAWVKAIGNENWAKQVELISFFTENDQTLGHFKLQIKY